MPQRTFDYFLRRSAHAVYWLFSLFVWLHICRLAGFHCVGCHKFFRMWYLSLIGYLSAFKPWFHIYTSSSFKPKCADLWTCVSYTPAATIFVPKIPLLWINLACFLEKPLLKWAKMQNLAQLAWEGYPYISGGVFPMALQINHVKISIMPENSNGCFWRF